LRIDRKLLGKHIVPSPFECLFYLLNGAQDDSAIDIVEDFLRIPLFLFIGATDEANCNRFWWADIETSRPLARIDGLAEQSIPRRRLTSVSFPYHSHKRRSFIWKNFRIF
jgi:hypothetical protein